MLGVLIMNTGTPDDPTPDAIRRYLKEFLSDRNLIDVLPALWQPILRLFILPNRPKKTAPQYRAIWTPDGSPFLLESLRLREGLQRRLSELASEQVAVALGMRYGNPSIASALAELQGAGADTIVALPLYPQTTRACAATCLEKFASDFDRLYGSANPKTPRVVPIERYWDAPGYLDALAASVKRAWEWKPGSKLVVSFHSIPLSHVQAGDPYPDQTRATAHELAGKLGIPTDDVLLTYQSRFDSRKWLGPMLEPELARLAQERVRDVAVVCPGFSIDCLETLHGVGEEAAGHFAQACEQAGNEGARLTYIPALGADPALVDTLARLVVETAGKR